METHAPSTATRPAGYAAIALVSAAGVVAASRLSRPALMLAAGLALAWWKKRQQVAETVTPVAVAPSEVVFEEVAASVESEDEFEQEYEPMPPAEMDASAPTVRLAPLGAFPVAPTRTETSITDAWDDLRAALVMSSAPTEPLTPPSPVSTHVLPMIPAPEMPEMYLFPPSSPLLDVDEEEGAEPEEPLHFFPQPAAHEPVGEIPDEICLPAFPAPGFLVTDLPPGEPAPSLLPRTYSAPLIVPRMDSAALAARAGPEVIPATELPKLPSAPVVLPREVQAKKSFFDWLRS